VLIYNTAHSGTTIEPLACEGDGVGVLVGVTLIDGVFDILIVGVTVAVGVILGVVLGVDDILIVGVTLGVTLGVDDLVGDGVVDGNIGKDELLTVTDGVIDTVTEGVALGEGAGPKVISAHKLST
jgi:hypothetical protein